MDLIVSFYEWPQFYPALLTFLSIFGYCIYLYIFKFHIYNAKILFGDGRKVRGKCPPFFPNGWYRVARQEEIKKGQTYYFEQCGRHIALFRGNDGVVYATDPYCPHMGANLGIKGEVKGDSCIQCPFHGFMFDGKTGMSVFPNGQPRKLTKCSYEHGIKEQKPGKDGNALIKGETYVPRLKTYHVREANSEVLVWIHSRDEKPLFEPLTYNGPLIERGEGHQLVNSQISELPENGADIRHFDYIHRYATEYFKPLQLRWEMKSMAASSPELPSYMKHWDKRLDIWQQAIIKKYVNEERKKYLNIISLDGYICLFGKELFFLNVTGFQVGPSLVNLFFNFRGLFEAAIFQSVTPLEKFMQRVINRIYIPRWMPYWVGAVLLRLEMQQVQNDLIVWNNKNYGDSPHYNFAQESDVLLFKWRNWYSQFYEGCHEREQADEKLNW